MAIKTTHLCGGRNNVEAVFKLHLGSLLQEWCLQQSTPIVEKQLQLYFKLKIILKITQNFQTAGKFFFC